LEFNIFSVIFETEKIKLNYKIMKMTLSNLRKLGLVLVAASTMAMVSCGGPTPEEEAAAEAQAEAMVNDMFSGIEDAMEEATEEVVEEAAEVVEEGAEVVEEAADAVAEEVHEHVEGDGHEH